MEIVFYSRIMYFKLLVLFLAVNNSSSRVPQPLAKIKLGKPLIVPKLRTECQKIICPETEDNICVRVKLSLRAVQSIHIIMTPCELEYKSCHPDLVSTIVSMKYCRPEDEEEPSVREPKGKERRRFKRAVENTKNSELVQRNPNQEMSVKNVFIHNTPRFPSSSDSVEVTVVELKKDADTSRHSTSNSSEEIRKELKTQEDGKVFIPANQQKSVQNVFIHNTPRFPSSSDSVEVAIVKVNKDADTSNSSEGDHTESKSKVDQNDKVLLPDDEESQSKVKGEEDKIIVLDSNVSPIESLPFDGFSTEKSNDDKHDSENNDDGNNDNEINNYGSSTNAETGNEEEQETNNEESDNDQSNYVTGPCPTHCPVRDVMVCAKCKHGIYRTFSSICHMRMFSCQEGNDALELIARYPCIMSAPVPFYTDKTKGRATEVDDTDTVLKYIKCRQTGQLNNNGKSIGNCDYGAIPDAKQALFATLAPFALKPKPKAVTNKNIGKAGIDTGKSGSLKGMI